MAGGQPDIFIQIHRRYLPEINVAVSADYARFLHGLIEDFLK